MKGKPAIYIIILAGIVLLTSGCKSGTSLNSGKKEILIRGIYGSPVQFWNRGLSLDSLHVNAIFLNWKSISEQMMDRSGHQNLKVFAEFPVLNGKGYVEQHPEAWAIDMYGKRVEPASWFMGVCPTEPGFRQYRLSELRELLMRFDLDGIWMDYMHWHAQFEEPEPILPETCFCPNCVSAFKLATGVAVPNMSTSEQAEWILANHDSEWRKWRCSVIADWVRDFRSVIKQERPEALLGIYHCPWDDTEFGGARYRILGLDYDVLKDLADVFSPMVYHGRMGREAGWVMENIEWFCSRLDIKPGSLPMVWPIVQAYDDPAAISPEEFELVLRYGAGSCATGIMMFTSNAVAQSPEKTEIMHKVYSEWMQQKKLD